MPRLRIMVMGLLLISVVVFAMGCNAADKEKARQFVDACLNYTIDVSLIKQTSTEWMNEDAELLKEGNITTRELRERYYFTLFGQAYALYCLDQKTENQALVATFMEVKAPPELARPPVSEVDTELAENRYTDYLDGYIAYHDYVVEQIMDYLKSFEPR